MALGHLDGQASRMRLADRLQGVYRRVTRRHASRPRPCVLCPREPGASARDRWMTSAGPSLRQWCARCRSELLQLREQCLVVERGAWFRCKGFVCFVRGLARHDHAAALRRPGHSWRRECAEEHCNRDGPRVHSAMVRTARRARRAPRDSQPRRASAGCRPKRFFIAEYVEPPRAMRLSTSATAASTNTRTSPVPVGSALTCAPAWFSM